MHLQSILVSNNQDAASKNSGLIMIFKGLEIENKSSNETSKEVLGLTIHFVHSK